MSHPTSRCLSAKLGRWKARCIQNFIITSPLIPKPLGQSSIRSGFAAELTETCKHQSNNAKCSELGWSCFPLAVETYGNWGKEAVNTFVHRIAMYSGYARSKVTHDLYSKMNLTLTRSIARATLVRGLGV